VIDAERSRGEDWDAVAAAIQDRLTKTRKTQMDVAARAQLSLTTIRELQHNLTHTAADRRSSPRSRRNWGVAPTTSSRCHAATGRSRTRTRSEIRSCRRLTASLGRFGNCANASSRSIVNELPKTRSLEVRDGPQQLVQPCSELAKNRTQTVAVAIPRPL
jgi:hypothetical protein